MTSGLGWFRLNWHGLPLCRVGSRRSLPRGGKEWGKNGDVDRVGTAGMAAGRDRPVRDAGREAGPVADAGLGAADRGAGGDAAEEPGAWWARDAAPGIPGGAARPAVTARAAGAGGGGGGAADPAGVLHRYAGADPAAAAGPGADHQDSGKPDAGRRGAAPGPGVRGGPL